MLEMEIISGSGVFARDPDSPITFTKHEEEGGRLWWWRCCCQSCHRSSHSLVRWDWPQFDEGCDKANQSPHGDRRRKAHLDINNLRDVLLEVLDLVSKGLCDRGLNRAL